MLTLRPATLGAVLLATFAVGFGAAAWLRHEAPPPPPLPPPVLPVGTASPVGWPCERVSFMAGRTDPNPSARADWRIEVIREQAETLVLAHLPDGSATLFRARDGVCEEWLNTQRHLPAKCNMSVERGGAHPLVIREVCSGNVPPVVARTFAHPYPPSSRDPSVEWQLAFPLEGMPSSERRTNRPAPQGWPCQELPASYLPMGDLPVPVEQRTFRGLSLFFARSSHGLQIFDLRDGMCVPRWLLPEGEATCEITLDEASSAVLALTQRCRTRSAMPGCIVRRLEWDPRLKYEEGQALGGEDPCAALAVVPKFATPSEPPPFEPAAIGGAPP